MGHALGAKTLSHEAEDRLTVEAFHPGAGRKCALSAVIAVSVATAVPCVQCDTLLRAPKLKSSNKRCNNFVVEDSVTKHRKQRDKTFNWAVHVVCRCVWRMRLFGTPLDNPKKKCRSKDTSTLNIDTLWHKKTIRKFWLIRRSEKRRSTRE